MMKIGCLLFVLLCTALPATAKTIFTSEQLKQKATAFIEAKNAKQQPDTKIEDIERFLSLYADNFVDEHVKFNVTVTDKNEFRKGLLYKMQDKVFYSKIDILDMMIGTNVVMVKVTESGKVKPQHLDKAMEYSNTHIISIEFDEKGLIRHMRRHHG